MSDSDIRVTPRFLNDRSRRVRQDPQLGVTTCPYRAVPGHSIWSTLEAIGMNTEFLVGILVARMLEGMKFALGPTIVARKDGDRRRSAAGTALKDYLAEDFVLGNSPPRTAGASALSSYVIEHRIGSQSFVANAQAPAALVPFYAPLASRRVTSASSSPTRCRSGYASRRCRGRWLAVPFSIWSKVETAVTRATRPRQLVARPRGGARELPLLDAASSATPSPGAAALLSPRDGRFERISWRLRPPLRHPPACGGLSAALPRAEAACEAAAGRGPAPQPEPQAQPKLQAPRGRRRRP